MYQEAPAEPGAAESLSSTSRHRVVRIIDRLNIGGPSKHVVWLTTGLDSAGFDTVLITGTLPEGEGDMSYFARAAGVTPSIIEEMGREISLRDLIVVAKLVRQLLKLKPDIVHTHKAKAGAVGRVAAMIYKWATPSILRLRPRRCAIVHTYHGHIFHDYYGPALTRLFIAIERGLARMCTDRIIVISEQQFCEISGTYRVGRTEQFRVIPLGIDLEEVNGSAGDLRSELGIAGDQTAIGISGRLCEIKNHRMFLQAAARIAGEPSARARFFVVGDGHLRNDLEQQSRELGLSDSVVFTGFREDAARLYRALDVAALTSLNEGTPVTLIEAMCCGRAVAATEVGGVRDLMGARGSTADGVTVWDHGVTVPSGDVEAFTRALRFLIEHPDLRKEMGERGRAFVISRMSKERLVHDVERVYSEVTGSSRQEETRSMRHGLGQSQLKAR